MWVLSWFCALYWCLIAHTSVRRHNCTDPWEMSINLFSLLSFDAFKKISPTFIVYLMPGFTFSFREYQIFDAEKEILWPVKCGPFLQRLYFYNSLSLSHLPRASSASFAWPTFRTGFGLIPTSRHWSSKHVPCRDYQRAFLNELIHWGLYLYNV